MKKIISLALLSAVFLAAPAKLISYDDSHYNNNAKWFVSTQLDSGKTKHEFDNKRKKVKRDKEIHNDTLAVYGEYHMCEDTILAKISGVHLKDWARNKNTGVDEIELGWQRKIWNCDEADRHLWTHLNVIIPGGDRNKTYRSGRHGLEAGFRFFTDFCSPKHGYFDMLMGYKFYSGYKSDLIFWNMRLGVELLSMLQLHFTSDLDYGMYNGSSKNIDGRRYQSAYRRLRIGAELEYKITECISLIGGGFSNVWGQDTINGGGFRAAIWARY